MRKKWSVSYVVALVVLGAFAARSDEKGPVSDLSGEWQVRLTDVCASVVLPGTLADARLGTRWTRVFGFSRREADGHWIAFPVSGRRKDLCRQRLRLTGRE